MVKKEGTKQKREDRDADDKDDKSPLKKLMQIVASIPLSLTVDGVVPFADVIRNGHVETLRVEGQEFAQLIEYRYFQQTGMPPPLEALNAAIRSLVSTARNQAPRREIDLRTSSYIDADDGRVLLIDLGDESWRYVRIARHGWEIRERKPTNWDPSGMDGAPVRLRRSSHMRALPAPVHGGSLLELAPFLGVRRSDALRSTTFLLGVSWVLTAITPWGVYLHLLINGQPGAGAPASVDLRGPLPG